MSSGDGWSGLFSAAFRQSKNAMVLADDRRTIVDVNGSLVALIGRSRQDLLGHRIFEFVDGGPVFSETEWDAALQEGRFTGEAVLMCADGGTVAVQWGGEHRGRHRPPRGPLTRAPRRRGARGGHF